MERLRHLLTSPDSADNMALEIAVRNLSQPANDTWVMARIAALLSPYYEKEIPESIRMMEAEDWADALCGLPEWAITKAVRWWKSDKNPKRHKRPLEGDILARVKIEMEAVRAAQIKLRLPVSGGAS